MNEQAQNAAQAAGEAKAQKYFAFSVAADIVALGVKHAEGADWRQAEELRMSIVLVLRGGDPFKGMWALPGGFLRRDSRKGADDLDMEACARREMREETGLSVRALIPFGNFSAVDRDPRGKGYISIPYVAIINIKDMAKALPQGGDDAVAAKWFTLHRTRQADGTLRIALEADGEERIAFSATCRGEGLGQPKVDVVYEKGAAKLAFDHAEILATAIYMMGLPGKRLRSFAFLGDAFTIAELRCVYEFMADEEIVPQSFRRNVVKYLERTGGMRGGKGHRPAALYRWKGLRPE